VTGVQHAIAALAGAGLDLIVHDVIADRAKLVGYLHALHGAPVLFVGLHAPADVLAARERSRPDRHAGTHLAHLPGVHEPGVYDLDLDMDQLSSGQAAQRVVEAVARFSEATAFDSLRRRLSVAENRPPR
jgi:chloramphenicol 3-O phosphotransferase